MAVGEWDQRELCPDGGCVGVIGPDGTCKVCGRAAQNWGDERKRGLIDPPDEDDGEAAASADDEDHDDHDHDHDHDEDNDEEEDEDEGDEDEDDAAEAAEDSDDRAAAAAASSAVTAPVPGDWGTRQLCPDGSCIGLIGPDGHCKACGRAVSDPRRPASPAAGAAPAEQVVETAPAAARPPATEDPPVSAGAPAAAPDGKDRVRCADSACPGLVADDGHCELCGKVAA